MRNIKIIVKAIPPLLLAGDAVALLFSLTTISKELLWFHSEMGGHSILTIIYIAYFSYRFKVCLYTWASISALLCLNILNLIYFFLPLDYYKLYAGIIITAGMLMTIVYAISANRPKPA